MIRRIKFIAGLFKIHRKVQPPVTVSNNETMPEIATMPVHACSPIAKPVVCHHRLPDKNEPLAFCDLCHAWTPMQFLPKSERGKSAETWFECEYCHGRKLTLRYLSMFEAVRRNASDATA